MTKDFELSRRKALAALGTVGIASAGAGLGTSAFFSDQETFENNSLVAGTLDVGVGYSAHYSDWSSDESEGVPNVRMWDGPAGTTGGPDDLEPDEVGLPANAAWLIAVSDDEDDGEPDTAVAAQFLENTEYQSFNDGTLDCVDGEANSQADEEDRPVIDLDDVKPGDFGEVTFDFILCDNPGFVWLNGSLQSASENGLTEPEADDPDEGPGVELLDIVRAAVWVDDGNNFQNDDEEPLAVGSIGEVLGMLDGESLGTALNGDIPAEEGGGAADARNCFSAETEHSFVFAWWVPVDHGNEIQSDTASFDLGLYAEQCRHNDGSGMNDEPTGGPGGEPGGDGDIEGTQAISFLAACVDDPADTASFIEQNDWTVYDSDENGPTAIEWRTDEPITALTVKYDQKYTTYYYPDGETSDIAATGADDPDGNPVTTDVTPDRPANDPCPNVDAQGNPKEYYQAEKLDFPIN